MSAKKGKYIYLNEVKIEQYLEFVKKVKHETSYQGMSFSRLCDIGSEIVQQIYNSLTEEEVESILGIEEFNAIIRDKLNEKFNFE